MSCVSSGSVKWTTWMSTILSACRVGENIQFDSFNLENKQDISRCAVFFQQLLKDCMKSNKHGARMLLQFLLNLCLKDLQILWRQLKHSINSFPMLYYLLGDSTATIILNIKKIVLPLYIQCLSSNIVNDLKDVRSLVSLCAILVSYCQALSLSFSFFISKRERADTIITLYHHTTPTSTVNFLST